MYDYNGRSKSELCFRELMYHIICTQGADNKNMSHQPRKNWIPCETSFILVIVMSSLVTCGCDRESRIERLAPKKADSELADNETNLSQPTKSELDLTDTTSTGTESGFNTNSNSIADSTEIETEALAQSGPLSGSYDASSSSEPQRVTGDRIFPPKYNNKRKTLIFLVSGVEFRTHHLITVFRDLLTDEQLLHAEEVVSRYDEELARLFDKRQKIIATATEEAKADEEILKIYKRTVNISRSIREQIINEVMTIRQRETHLKRVKVQEAIREQGK